MIYLDYASHTPADEDVIELLCKTERKCAGNPLAAHQLGRAANDALQSATKGIAAFFDAPPGNIIHTSGASEANNLAIKGIAKAYGYSGRHILSTCLEHPSVSGALAFLAENGYQIELLKILPDGKIDLPYLQEALRPDTILLCVSAVDSELGAVQPLDEIAKIAADFPVHLHIDAAQAIGKIPLPPDALRQAATICFSPHKFHGLNGCGVLVKRQGVVLEPQIHGGSEANGLLYRGGTPSPAMAAACYHALEKALRNLEENFRHVAGLRDYLNLPAGLEINSPPDASPYIINVSATGISGKSFQSALDERGIAVSVKSACSTDNAPSRAVFAVTGDKKRAANSWRISLSHKTTQSEIAALSSATREILANERSKFSCCATAPAPSFRA